MNRIEWIKSVRENTGLSLKEAVRYVDNMLLHEQVTNATTIDDLKRVLHILIENR